MHLYAKYMLLTMKLNMNIFEIENIIPKQASKCISRARKYISKLTVAYIKANVNVDGIFRFFLHCKVCSLLIFTQMCYMFTRVTDK